jgi:2-haloacid dehalogenase
MSNLHNVRALLFDVFGSVVDWRGSIQRDLGAWGSANGKNVDWEAFARDWRSQYQPNLEQVRSGRRPFELLDKLHREALDELLPKYGIEDLSDAQKDHINRVWHRLDGWPDSVPGLLRLKARFTIAPLSNGNVSLLNNMAKYAGLPWDLNLSTQWFSCYKPQPQTYLGAVKALGLEPEQVMMCAAHNDDLKAARKSGLKTAFWARPNEYGVDQIRDFHATDKWDVVCKDIRDLADQLLG